MKYRSVGFLTLKSQKNEASSLDQEVSRRLWVGVFRGKSSILLLFMIICMDETLAFVDAITISYFLLQKLLSCIL